MDGPPIWTDSRYMGPRTMDIEAMWHPHGLSKLQEILNGNILHPTIAPGQWSPYMGRIPQNTYINEDLFQKERSFCPRNKSQFYTTIKTPSPKK